MQVQAYAGPGYAGSTISCAPGCHYSTEGEASASAAGNGEKAAAGVYGAASGYGTGHSFSLSAAATVGGGAADASAGCSGATTCVGWAEAGASDSAVTSDGTYKAAKSARCEFSGNAGCGAHAAAVAAAPENGGGATAECYGDGTCTKSGPGLTFTPKPKPKPKPAPKSKTPCKPGVCGEYVPAGTTSSGDPKTVEPEKQEEASSEQPGSTTCKPGVCGEYLTEQTSTTACKPGVCGEYVPAGTKSLGSPQASPSKGQTKERSGGESSGASAGYEVETTIVCPPGRCDGAQSIESTRPIEEGEKVVSSGTPDRLPGMYGGYQSGQPAQVRGNDGTIRDATPAVTVNGATELCGIGRGCTKGAGNLKASYSPGAGARTFRTKTPAAIKNAAPDITISDTFAAASRDARGNGHATVHGNGKFRDGATGTTIKFGVIAPTMVNHVRPTDAKGGRVMAVDADGRQATFKTGLPDGKGLIDIVGRKVPTSKFGRDHFVIGAPEVAFAGRDGKGHSGTVDWTGAGHGRTAEGIWVGVRPEVSQQMADKRLDPFFATDMVRCNDPGCPTEIERAEQDGFIPDLKDGSPWFVDKKKTSVSVATPGSNGLGGHITVDGSATITAPGGKRLDCLNECVGTYEMPTEKGAGGTFSCSVGAAAGGSYCAGTDVQEDGTRDVQKIAVPDDGRQDFDPGLRTLSEGSATFFQFLRNDDGSGGSAVAFVDGAAEAHGATANGDWISTWGEKEGHRGGSVLLYPEQDGYNTGQACTGKCNGSTPADERLPWVDPTPEVTEAVGMYGPDALGAGRGETASRTDLLRNPARAVAQYARDGAHIQWISKPENLRAAQDVIDDLEKANSEGHDALEEAYENVDPTLLKRLLATEGAIDTLNAVMGAAPTGFDRRELGDGMSPELTAEILGVAGKTVLRGKDNADRANDTIIAAEQDVIDISLEMDEQNFDGRQAAIDAAASRINKEGKALDDERKRLVAAFDDPTADPDQLMFWQDDYNRRVDQTNAERGRNEAASQALTAERNSYLSEIAAAQGTLRDMNQAVAEDSGDPDLVASLNAAEGLRNSVEGLLSTLPEPRRTDTRTFKEDARTLADVYELGSAIGMSYDAAVEAPRRYSHPLGDLRLPSTLSADVPLAMRGGKSYDFFEEIRDTHPTGPLAGMSDNDIADLASTWAYGNPRELSEYDIAKQNALPATGGELVQALIGWDDGSAEYDTRYDNLFRQFNSTTTWPWESKNNSWLGEVAGATLPQSERDDLYRNVDHNDPMSLRSVGQYLIDGSDYMVADVEKGYNAALGAGYDDVLVNLGRGVVKFGVGTLSLGHRALGATMVQTNTFAENERNRLKSGDLTQIGTVAYSHLSPVGYTVHSMFQPDLHFTQPRQGNETDTDYYQRLAPLTGGFIRTPVANAIDRHIVEHTAAKDYHDHPLETLMEDLTPILLITAPLSGALRAGARGAAVKGSAVADELARARALPKTEHRAATRALETQLARHQRQAAGLDMAASVASIPGKVMAAPFTVAGLPVRLAGLGTKSVAVPVAGRLQTKSNAARASGETALADQYATRAAEWAARAETGRMTFRYGALGRFSDKAAYGELGVSRVATNDAVVGAAGGRLGKLDPSSPIGAARQMTLERSLLTIGVRRARSEPMSVAESSASAGRLIDEVIHRLLDRHRGGAMTVEQMAQSLGVDASYIVKAGIREEAARGADGARFGIGKDRRGRSRIELGTPGELAARHAAEPTVLREAKPLGTVRVLTPREQHVHALRNKLAEARKVGNRLDSAVSYLQLKLAQARYPKSNQVRTVTELESRLKELRREPFSEERVALEKRLEAELEEARLLGEFHSVRAEMADALRRGKNRKAADLNSQVRDLRGKLTQLRQSRSNPSRSVYDLELRLEELRRKPPSEERASLEKQLEAELEEARLQLEAEFDKARLQGEFHRAEAQLAEHNAKVAELEAELNRTVRELQDEQAKAEGRHSHAENPANLAGMAEESPTAPEATVSAGTGLPKAERESPAPEAPSKWALWRGSLWHTVKTLTGKVVVPVTMSGLLTFWGVHSGPAVAKTSITTTELGAAARGAADGLTGPVQVTGGKPSPQVGAQTHTPLSGTSVMPPRHAPVVDLMPALSGGTGMSVWLGGGAHLAPVMAAAVGGIDAVRDDARETSVALADGSGASLNLVPSALSSPAPMRDRPAPTLLREPPWRPGTRARISGSGFALIGVDEDEGIHIQLGKLTITSGYVNLPSTKIPVIHSPIRFHRSEDMTGAEAHGRPRARHRARRARRDRVRLASSRGRHAGAAARRRSTGRQRSPTCSMRSACRSRSRRRASIRRPSSPARSGPSSAAGPASRDALALATGIAVDPRGRRAHEELQSMVLIVEERDGTLSAMEPGRERPLNSRSEGA